MAETTGPLYATTASGGSSPGNLTGPPDNILATAASLGVQMISGGFGAIPALGDYDEITKITVTYHNLTGNGIFGTSVTWPGGSSQPGLLNFPAPGDHSFEAPPEAFPHVGDLSVVINVSFLSSGVLAVDAVSLTIEYELAGTGAPAIRIAGQEVQCVWFVSEGGQEVPLTYWAISQGGQEVPLT